MSANQRMQMRSTGAIWFCSGRRLWRAGVAVICR
jgi:hypothetical protein